MPDSRWEHCNQPHVYERMILIRDILGNLAAEGRWADSLPDEEKGRIARLFEGDMDLFAFMDETPGDMLVNGRPPEGERGGPGGYYDGEGRRGWHTLLRQLRNAPGDAFWEPFRARGNVQSHDIADLVTFRERPDGSVSVEPRR